MSQRLHVCRICGKKFATLKGVHGHQRIHSGKSNRIEDDNGLQRIWGLKKSRVCSVSASSAKETETCDLLRIGSSFMTEIEKHEVREAAMNLVMLSQRVYDFASIRNLLPGDDSIDLDQLKPMQGKKLHCVESKLDEFSEMVSHSGFERSGNWSEIRFSDAVVARGLPCPLRSKLEKKTHSSYKCDICDKRCSQALGSHQSLHRSIKGKLVRKNEYIEGDRSLSHSLEAKEVVTQPSSFEVSQEEKILQCVEPKLDFQKLLAHSGSNKSNTCSKTRFCAFPSPPEVKKIVSQPSTVEFTVDEKILHCAESKLDDFHELLAYSGFNKSSSCSKTRFSALHSPLRSKWRSSYRFKICGKIFECSQALDGQQSLHRSTNGHKRDYTEDGNSPSGETDSEASKIVSQPSSFKSQGI